MSRIEELVEGLTIIKNTQPKADFDFQHDIMYVGDSNLFNKEDKEKLESLGFCVDEEFDCFSLFS